jgi:hypothetical protein
MPPTPFQLSPETAESLYEMPSPLRVEPRRDAWVVRDEDGSYWCGLVENGWSSSPDDDDMPALSFPSAAEARAAYAQADRMYGDRVKRHKQALAQLGLTDE